MMGNIRTSKAASTRRESENGKDRRCWQLARAPTEPNFFVFYWSLALLQRLSGSAFVFKCAYGTSLLMEYGSTNSYRSLPHDFHASLSCPFTGIKVLHCTRVINDSLDFYHPVTTLKLWVENGKSWLVSWKCKQPLERDEALEFHYETDG